MANFVPFPQPPPMPGLAEAFASRRAGVLRRLDWEMVPYHSILISVAVLILLPLDQPGFLAWVGFGNLMVALFLLMGVLVVASGVLLIQSFVSGKSSSERMPATASRAFSWFTVHQKLALDLWQCGVTGREIALVLYSEGVRGWRAPILVLATMVGWLLTALLFATIRHAPGVPPASVWLWWVLMLVTIGLYTNLMLSAIGLLELDSRYYAWLKTADYSIYLRRGFVVGVLVGMGSMAVMLPVIVTVRGFFGEWVAALLTAIEPENTIIKLISILQLGALALIILWPLARQVSALLLRRRIRRMDEYYPRLCEFLIAQQK